MRKVLLPSLAVVLLVGVLWTWSIKKSQQSQEAKQQTFRSAVTSLSFTYPITLGAARESVQDSTSTDGIVQSGEGVIISFENNAEVHFILAGRDYQEFKGTYFTGSVSSADSCPNAEVGAKGNGCALAQFDGKTWLKETRYIADEGVFNLLLTYSLPLPSPSEYGGLMAVQSFPSISFQLNATDDQVERERLARQYAEGLLGIGAEITDVDIIDQKRVFEEIIRSITS